MIKMIRFVFVLFLPVLLSVPGKSQFNSVYDELVSVNPEWKNQPDVKNQLKSEPAKPLSEQQLVQLHLSETEKLLRRRDINNLSPRQKENRIKNLNVLHEYLIAGMFPVNNLHYNRQPYFIDDNNTYCAVGYLMKESGANDMARSIHKTQNYSYLKDIYHAKLMDWVQQSGLSFDELALIQPGYPGDVPATFLEFHYNNTGTDVNEYIEVRQGKGFSGRPFSTVVFYDSNGILYKTLQLTDMQSDNSYPPIFFYVFGSNESFADSGRIELRNQIGTFSSLLSAITYNGNFITDSDYNYFPTVKTYQFGENESTPVNTSLNFCGTYPNSWTLSSLPATIGTINPCVDLLVPITLSKFSYTLNQSKVNLFWETLTETNNKAFVVERSENGTDFRGIGTIPASTNSNAAKQYTYTDNQPQYINYYRLKQIDIDGKISYSKTLYVKVDNASRLILRQTVVSSELYYQIKLPVTSSGVEIYDITGRKMYSNAASTGNQQINVSRFPAGKYIIRLLTSDGHVYTQQFVKQ